MGLVELNIWLIWAEVYLRPMMGNCIKGVLA